MCKSNLRLIIIISFYVVILLYVFENQCVRFSLAKDIVVKKLTLHAVEAIDELAWPANYQEFTLRSPALHVFTDFKNLMPLVIESNTKATDVEFLMKKAHVRLKLVIDKHEKFLGLISFDSLNHQEIVKKQADGHHRDNLLISDFMIPKSQLKAIDYADIVHAKIGDIIETLKAAGQQHCLVVDREHHTIRGVLSANDIAKRLKLDIDVSTPTSFASIFEVISKVTHSIVA